MSIITYTSTILAKQPLDADSALITIAKPADFEYTPGQFITLHHTLQGQLHKRSYSLCSHPYLDDQLQIAVKALLGGLVSGYLVHTIQPGATITFDQAMGSFIPNPASISDTQHYIFFAAGSGITPIYSIIKELLLYRRDTRVSLFYGARKRENIWFQQQLNKLETEYRQRFNLHYLLTQPDKTWVGLTGRITQAMSVYLIKQVAAASFPQAQYYLCGPEAMMAEVQKALSMLNIPENQIHVEKFHLPEIKPDTNNPTEISHITIIDGANRYSLDVAKNEYILQKALEKNIPMPYSCQSGMCTACMAKCTHGAVEMIDQEGLTENEIKKGYILTCVARPLTAEVTIEV